MKIYVLECAITIITIITIKNGHACFEREGLNMKFYYIYIYINIYIIDLFFL